ncbi:MAG TPA: hypothetical protein VGV88_01200 [Candidatus Dormibacteraeota bacterium]|nr:hypothetical protein [Candidatus Dormibacteraeota bacterium]
MVSVRRLRASVHAVLVLSTVVALVASLLPVTGSAAATSANLSQCTNGTVGPPISPEQCAGSSTAAILNGSASASGVKNWVNGNSNGSKSHWRESDFISYRAQVFAPAGAHSLQIHYDTVHSGGHAIDYLGNFDGTETTSPTASTFNANYNNPCADEVYASPSQMALTDCEHGAPGSTVATPTGTAGAVPSADLSAAADCSAGINGTFTGSQVPGSVKIFGPNGSNVGAVTYVGQNVASGSGQCTTTVKISFTIGGSGSMNVVLAWGGHIASEANWGAGNSAQGINGSPYHMALDNLDGTTLGSQDRALATTAIFFPTVTTTALSATAISVGGSVHDTSTTTGAAAAAGGTVTFTVYSNNTCTTPATTGAGGQISAQPGSVAVSNNGAGTLTGVSPSVTFNTAGTYYWLAAYGGDSGTNTQPSTSACTSEIVTVAAPSLKLTKTADAAAVNAGSPIGFTLTLANSGGGDATGVTLTDNLPAGPSGSGVDWGIASQSGPAVCAITGSAPSQALGCGTFTLASGTTETVHVTSATTTAACGNYNNTASFTTGNDGSGSQSASTSVNCPTTVATQLSATTISTGGSVSDQATISGAAPTAGGTITYKVYSDNTCTTLVADATPGVNTVTNGIAPASKSVTFNSAGTFYWQAVYSGDPSTNTIGSSSACTSEVVTVLAPNLSLTKTADAGTVSAGDQIGYTLTISNSGPGTASGVVVNDTLPTNAGLSWSISGPANGWNLSAGLLSFGPATLGPGASATVHIISLTTSATCGVVNNSASAISSNDGSPSVGPVSITVNCPVLSITKQADASPVSTGTNIGFTVTVINGGAGNAYGVMVNDPLPAGGNVSWAIDSQPPANACAINSPTAPQTLSCTLGTVAPGASYTVHIFSTTDKNSAGDYPNTATVMASNAPTQSANADIVVQAPNLQLTKTADAGTVSAGDQIGYTLTISNTGAGTATGVVVNDTLPTNAGLSWSISGPANGWSINAGVLSFGPATLAPNASSSVHIISLTTSATCGVVNNSASAISSNDGSPSVGPVSITVECPLLTITKTADTSPVSTGTNIGFTVTVSNSGAAGTGSAHDVTVSDPLPAGGDVSWSIDSQSLNSCSISGTAPTQTLNCNLGTMAPGTSYMVHIVSTTDATSFGDYPNTATVTASNAPTKQASADIMVLAPHLTLTKTADAGTVSAGDPIGYVITLTNAGAGTATNVTVNDTLPTNAGLAWSIASQSGGTWSISGGVLSFSAASFGPGASSSVHITSPTTSATCGTVDNSAIASSSNDGSPSAGPVGITINCPNLEISKTADAGTVSTGDQIGYTVTVTNAGLGTAHNVTVSDTVPTGAGISWSIDPSGTTGSWTLSGGVLGFGPVDLASGASFHVHIVSPTTFDSCAVINNSAGALADNNGPVSIGPVPITINCPSLGVVKTADATPVSTGDPIGFNIVVSNGGPGIARSVTLLDSLPGGPGISWSIAGGSGALDCTIAGSAPQVLSCSFGDLGSGANFTIHITSATDATSAGTYTNNVTVSATNAPSANSSATVVVQPPSLSVTKTPDASTVSTGDTIGFTITVTNAGPGVARSVLLSDPLPTGGGISWAVDGGTAAATCLPIVSNTLTCTLGDLLANASATVHISSSTNGTSAGSYPNTATATPTNGGPASGSGTIVVQPPSLSVTKTPDNTPVSTGDKIGFNIVVSNAGPGVARSVSLTDLLPTGSGINWSIDSTSVGTCSIGGGTLTCNLGDLAAGGSATVHISSSTDGTSAGTYPNTATATPTNGGAASGSGTIVVQPPSLSVTKTPDHGIVNTGDQIGFTITVSNSGPGIARSVTLTDPLPTGTGISWAVDGGSAAATCLPISSNTLTCNLGDLAVGASATVHISSPTTAGSAGTINNTATATPTNGGSASGSGTVVVQPPSLSITKNADATSVNAGGTIGFTITLSNAGPGAANGVTINDNLPGGAGVNWTIASANGPASCSISGSAPAQTLSCASFSLAAAQSESIHVTSSTATASCGNYNNTATFSAANDGTGSASATEAVNCPTSVTTSLSGGGSSGGAITVPTGTAVTDQAIITGAAPTAGGTVTYQYTTDPKCLSGLTSAGTASVTNGQAGPSNAITFNSSGTFYWVANYSGDPSTNTAGSTSACGSEVLTVFFPQVSQITPTQTTCSQFASGTAPTLSSVMYSTKGSTISSDNPGVMFYWVKVTVTSAGTHTYTITQTTNYAPTSGSPLFTVASGSFAFDASCNALATTLSGPASNLQVTFSGKAGTYYIGIKYSPKSVVGTGPAATAPLSSYTYTFQTTGVGGSTDTIKLIHQ